MRKTVVATALTLLFGLALGFGVAVAEDSNKTPSNEPKIKVYGNKTPTMIGTPEEIAKYRQELEQREQFNNSQVTYSYVDENGNTVTVQSGKDNNYGIDYGGSFYYDGYWYGNNGNYGPPGTDGRPPYPDHKPPYPGHRPPGHRPPHDGNVHYPPPPPHWAPTSPNVATGPDGRPLPPPQGLPTPSLP